MENNRPLPPPPQTGQPPRPNKRIPSGAIHQQPSYGLKSARRKRRWWPWVIIAAIALIMLTIGGSYMWYQRALEPVDAADTEKVRVAIDQGSTASQIAQTLKEQDLIRSVYAFELYARGAAGTGMQAGGYMLSRSMSVSEIVNHLVEGKSDSFQVTFIPGSNIWEVKENLVESGYDEAEIDQALEADYDHPLFASKPPNTSLEGYIFPDTYEVEGDATVEDIFRQTFDEFYGLLQEKNLMETFASQDLTLYEAITLGSIIQKEVAIPEDERQVAQVFLKRLDEGMPLGADATFIYAGLLLDVEPRVTLDSPYNTRQVGGLPPGPISNVAISALEAVANPAEGDFLYFVSGDDGTTHFTRTEEEHEEATRLYCHENCDIFRN